MSLLAIVSAQPHLPPLVSFQRYPGYEGVVSITGHASAVAGPNGLVGLVWYLDTAGWSDACATTPEGVANACGIHIHAGTTCDDADAVGGHYYDADSITSDPWSSVTYTTAFGKTAGFAKVSIGDGQDISGRALVVHDHTGARIACGLLSASQLKAVWAPPAVTFQPYPGYAGPLKVVGAAGAHPGKDQVGIWWSLTGVEDACKTTPEGVANACGIHIHAGNTCDDADAVGGHYYNTDTIDSDPWSPISYATWIKGTTAGYATIAIGDGQDVSGRALVVHDQTGARVACGLLPAGAFTVSV